ncbi:hypothetical protein, partial [Bordetella pseudohinzii]
MVHITGPGSSLVTGEILLGGRTPTLHVENQGRLHVHTLNLHQGKTVVSGPGSSLTIRDYGAFALGRNPKNYVGWDGNGTLEVKDGGTVISHATAQFTFHPDDAGTLLVSGASSVVTLNKGLNSTMGGAATIKIQDGGSLISKHAATFGTPRLKMYQRYEIRTTRILVDGEGSRWHHSEGTFKLQSKAGIQLSNRGALDLGDQTLHLAGKHSQVLIGGGPDDEAQAGGTLTAGQLAFSSDASKANSQKLVFNHIPTEAGLEFAPVLSGKGNIEHK